MTTAREKKRSSVWLYSTTSIEFNDPILRKHPAKFPEALAKDCITSWSNENDLVYDPMAGSGTVAKSSIDLKRNWIASEITEEYCDIIKYRLDNMLKVRRKKNGSRIDRKQT